MIIVDASPLDSFSSSTPSPSPQGTEILKALIEHPTLLSASRSFKDIPERKFSILPEADSGTSTNTKCVYIFQREYATVDPALVDLVGTDEATTCVGIAIRNRKTGMTSVAHMDAPNIVETGLVQMLSLVVHNDLNAELDVHLVGGFEDTSPKHTSNSSRSESNESNGKPDGYSLPLCVKIVEALWKRREKFHIQTFFVLEQNTKRDSEGNAFPFFHGFLVETSTGYVFPACFDRTSRCPDEIVRRIRVTACNEDPTWEGKLLDTYDTLTDKFAVAPCCWSRYQVRVALALYDLSDSEILLSCSTSPLSEGPDFVDNIRRQWDYLIEHPSWKATFPEKRPRVFERISSREGWKRC